MVDETGLNASVEQHADIENLEAVVLSLGQSKSGMYQKVSEELQRHLIKHNGSLVYQQLFNGKIIVLLNYPFIENYGKPRPPNAVTRITLPFIYFILSPHPSTKSADIERCSCVLRMAREKSFAALSTLIFGDSCFSGIVSHTNSSSSWDSSMRS